MPVQIHWIDQVGDSLVASIIAPLARPVVAQITDEIAGLFKAKPAKNLVLDLQHKDQVNVGVLMLVGNLKRVIKESATRFFITGARKEVMRYIERNGIAGGISFLDSIKEVAQVLAPVRAAPTVQGPAGLKPTLDVKFINPFIVATQRTLKDLCNIETKAERPFLRKDAGPASYEMGAVLKLETTAFSGTIVIGFSRSTFLGLLSGMLGEKIESYAPELDDGASEILNVIFGHAKRELNRLGYGIKMAIPSVVHGYESSSCPQTLVLPMASPYGDLRIEIAPKNAA